MIIRDLPKRVIPVVTLCILLSCVIFMQCAKVDDVITVGAIVPLTGENATYGVSLKRGMDLALKSVNSVANDKSKPRLKIVYEDDQADPKLGVSAIRKLLAVEKPPIVIGAMFSAVTLAIAPIAEESKTVLLSPTSSSVDLTNAGDYVFRIYPSDSYDGKFLADYALETLHDSTCAIVAIQVSSVKAIVDVFTDEYVRRGGEVVLTDWYQEGATDFRSQIAKVTQVAPDLLFFPGYLQEMALFLRQSKELRMSSEITKLTISTFYDPRVFEITGDAADNVIFSTPAFSVTSSDMVIQEFVTSFQEEYGVQP